MKIFIISTEDGEILRKRERPIAPSADGIFKTWEHWSFSLGHPEKIAGREPNFTLLRISI